MDIPVGAAFSVTFSLIEEVKKVVNSVREIQPFRARVISYHIKIDRDNPHYARLWIITGKREVNSLEFANKQKKHCFLNEAPDFFADNSRNSWTSRSDKSQRLSLFRNQ